MAIKSILSGLSRGVDEFNNPGIHFRKKMEEDLLRQRHEQAKGIMDYEEKLRREAKDREEAEIVSSLATTLPNESKAPGILPPRDPMVNAQLARNEAKAASSLQAMGGARRLRGGLDLQEDIGRVGAEGELAKGKFDLASTAALLSRAGETAEAKQFAEFGRAKADTELARNIGGNAILDRSFIEKDMGNRFRAADVKGGELQAALEDQKFANAIREKTQEATKAAIDLGLSKAQAETEIAKLVKLIGEGVDIEKISNLSEAQKILAGVLTRGLTEEQMRLMQIRAANVGGQGSNPNLLEGVISSIRNSGMNSNSPPASVTNPSGISSIPGNAATPIDINLLLKGMKFNPGGA